MRPDPLPGPSETPNPRPIPSVEGDIPADEWQRRYMAYLARLNSYPPYTALIDIREAGFKETKITLERIYTNLEVPSAEHLRRLPKKVMTDLDGPELDELGGEQREPVLKPSVGRKINDWLFWAHLDRANRHWSVTSLFAWPGII